MEDLVNHLLHFAMWAFFVIFAFAAIGVFATVRWIVRLVRGTEAAVGSGINSAENVFRR
jgi:hypothetical protein